MVVGTLHLLTRPDLHTGYRREGKNNLGDFDRSHAPTYVVQGKVWSYCLSSVTLHLALTYQTLCSKQL